MIRFAALALIAFALSTFGADVASRTLGDGTSFRTAAAEHLQAAWAQPVGTGMLFAPFACLGLLSFVVAWRSSQRRGLALFGAVALVLLLLYALGFEGARLALAQQQWTAAALLVGLLPFYSIPLLLLAAVAAWLLVRTARKPAAAAAHAG